MTRLTRLVTVGLGEIDSRLTSEVALVRKGLQEPYPGDQVVISPQLEEYEPFITPSGVMHLGKFGVEDFEQTFSNLGVNTTELLVVYSAIRHSLEAKRRANPDFHTELGSTALKAMKSGILPGQDRHKTETQLIGYVSASCARKRVARNITPKATRERLPSQIITEARRTPKHDVRKYKTSRRLIIGHLGLSFGMLDEVIPRLIKAAKA